MKKNKLYFTYLFLILLFLSEVLFLKEKLDPYLFNIYYRPPSFVYQASIKPFSREIKTEKEEGKEPIILNVNSAIVVRVSGDDEEILFEKESKTPFPIASLTKLMTAWVVLEHPEYYSISESISMSEEALEKNGGGKIKQGEQVILNDLLHAMLIQSSNDSAYAIAEAFDEGDNISTPKEKVNSFISLMNLEAEKLFLKKTSFSNCTGLDVPGLNKSTSYDLAEFAKYILKKHPEIFEISAKPYYPISNNKGDILYLATNRNELLEEMDYLFGGKTGWTPKAGGCILLIQEIGQEDYLISIVLGADSPQERFSEIKKLIYLATNNLEFIQ